MAEHDEYWDGLAVGFALDALEPEDEALFREHLRTCERCALTVDEALALAGEMALATPVEMPPESLRTSIGELARRTPQPRPGPSAAAGSPVSARTPEQPRSPEDRDELAAFRRRRGPAEGAAVPAERSAVGDLAAARTSRAERRPLGRRLVAAAAAVILVVLGGVGVVQTHRVSQQQHVAAEQRRVLQLLGEPGTRAVALKSAKAGSTASARVLVADGHAFVVTTGLAKNASSSTYVLWAVRSVTPLAVSGVSAFDVGSGSVSVVDAGPVAPNQALAAGYAVSLEPGRTVPRGPTDIVLSSA